MSNWTAPDGYRYGVMFTDESVAEYWNGRTQRDHAHAYADKMRAEYPDSNITLARQKPGEPWERVDD